MNRKPDVPSEAELAEYFATREPAKRGRKPRGKVDANTYFSMVCTKEFHERLTALRMADPSGDLTKADVVRKLVDRAFQRISMGEPWLS
jgi:hypothetical protein